MLNNGPSALDALKIMSNPTLFRTRTFVAGRWGGSGATAVVPASERKIADVDDCDLTLFSEAIERGRIRGVSVQQH
ncbi:hypothetical protein N181_11550 [Sinorhizobium fredii USDA 205]|nr:hypothetical protein AOX55_00003268 [Sinorhizobium fredii CCBAU 25509]KSV90672.1 hypothetical protein N181_11550 [Sinorhizobium fredii USDA 205]GLS07805.1 hypothetical protein GCM10007864_14330 [Sinorhizobium fredii]